MGQAEGAEGVDCLEFPDRSKGVGGTEMVKRKAAGDGRRVCRGGNTGGRLGLKPGKQLQGGGAGCGTTIHGGGCGTGAGGEGGGARKTMV